MKQGLRMKQLLSALALVLIVVAVDGCRRHEATGARKPGAEIAKTTFRRLAGPMDEELLRTASASSTVRKIQEEGILVASVKCETPRLCERNKYGVATGLEADLLKRIAALLGVKLNIVSSGPAVVYGAGSDAPKESIVASAPYFYSDSGGWLRFSVVGDKAFEKTVSGIIISLYDTGTYQQLYKNHFAIGKRNLFDGAAERN